MLQFKFFCNKNYSVRNPFQAIFKNKPEIIVFNPLGYRTIQHKNHFQSFIKWYVLVKLVATRLNLTCTKSTYFYKNTKVQQYNNCNITN